MSTNSASRLFKLGLYQIIGGGLGILMFLYSLITLPSLSGLIILVYGFMSVFFFYSILCGWLCLKSKENALQHSLINQFLQLIGFAVLGFAFSYAAGIYVSIGLDFTKSFEFKFGLGVSEFQFI